MSWKPRGGWRAGSSLACADLGGELHVAVGQRRRVEGAVGGGKVRCSAVDDAVEAGRAAGAGGRPLEGPAGLQVALAGEDDEVLAEHVAAEGDGAGLVVVAGGPAVLQDAVLADDPVAGHQRLGGESGDGSGGGEELDGGQLAGEGQPTGGVRGGLRRGGSGGAACYRERGQCARCDSCPELHRESLLGKPESASLACGGTGLAAIGHLADIAVVQGPCGGRSANFVVPAASGRRCPTQAAAGRPRPPARYPRCRIASAASWVREVM